MNIKPTTHQRGWCVYRCFDAVDKLLYVGMTQHLTSRMCNHKCKSAWHKDVARVTWDEFTTRNDALIAEGRAIESEKPLFNKSNEGWQGISGAMIRAEEIERRWEEEKPKLQVMWDHIFRNSTD